MRFSVSDSNNRTLDFSCCWMSLTVSVDNTDDDCFHVIDSDCGY